MAVQELSYAERAALCSNPTARALFETMERKKSNLSVAVDVTKKADLIAIADAIGPHICMLKTHIDVIDDFDAALARDLSALAEKHDFVIFEDRKFADIGNTVKLQYRDGVYRIADWAHVVDAHVVPGPGIVEGLREVGLPKGRGLLLLAEMSSKGALATGSYTEAAISMANDYTDFVIGFICSRRLVHDRPSLLHCTPGVSMADSGDALGQQYRTPEQVVAGGSDVIIVGRGVYGSGDARANALRYREAGWAAYCKRIGRDL
eukprot:Opistho-2@8461